MTPSTPSTSFDPHGATRSAVAAWVGITALLFASGCPSPNSYGTPRTIPARTISQTFAAEVVDARGVTPTGTAFRQTLPSTPTYQIRVGLWDRGDLGIRIAHLSTLGADLKWNFVRGRRLDVAIDPGAQVFVASDKGSAGVTTYFHAPVLFGINVSQSVSLVPSVGLTYSASSMHTPGNDIRGASTDSGALARIGLGLNLRFRNRFALQPEVTYLRNFDAATRSFILAGLGMTFGSIPSYDDLDPELEAERKAGGWTESDGTGR